MFLRLSVLIVMAASAASWSQERAVEVPVRIVPQSPERFAYPGHAVEGFHLQQSSNKGLWVTGVSAMAASTGASLFVLLSTRDALSLIPLAGPFLYAARRVLGIPNVSYSDSFETFTTVASIVSGITQVVGAALLVIGLTNPKVWLERDDAPRVSLAVPPTSAQLRVTF